MFTAFIMAEEVENGEEVIDDEGFFILEDDSDTDSDASTVILDFMDQ